MTTKFYQDGSLDCTTFKKNIDKQLEARIHVVIGGSLGEASTLTKEEKLKLLSCTRENIGNKISVIVNITERITEDAVQMAVQAEKMMLMDC